MKTKILYSKEKKKKKTHVGRKNDGTYLQEQDIRSAGWKNENDDPLKYNNIKDDKDSL